MLTVRTSRAVRVPRAVVKMHRKLRQLSGVRHASAAQKRPRQVSVTLGEPEAAASQHHFLMTCPAHIGAVQPACVSNHAVPLLTLLSSDKQHLQGPAQADC